MNIDVKYEFYVILYAIILGIAGAMVYDVIRIARRVIKRGVILTGIGDLLYWSFMAVATFIYLYQMNGGVVRFYVIFFIFLGMFLWEISVGRYVVKFVSKILKKILKIADKYLKKIVKPFKIINSFCTRKIRKFIRRGASVNANGRERVRQSKTSEKKSK